MALDGGIGRSLKRRRCAEGSRRAVAFRRPGRRQRAARQPSAGRRGVRLGRQDREPVDQRRVCATPDRERPLFRPRALWKGRVAGSRRGLRKPRDRRRSRGRFGDTCGARRPAGAGQLPRSARWSRARTTRQLLFGVDVRHAALDHAGAEDQVLRDCSLFMPAATSSSTSGSRSLSSARSIPEAGVRSSCRGPGSPREHQLPRRFPS
jgi:hypothetical protein